MSSIVSCYLLIVPETIDNNINHIDRKIGCLQHLPKRGKEKGFAVVVVKSSRYSPLRGV